MKILNSDSFPFGTDKEVVRAALTNQRKLLEFRKRAKKIDPKNAELKDLLDFVEYVKNQTG